MNNLQAMFFVLNKTEVLDRLLLELSEAGIRGATVINSTGMAHSIASREDSPAISTFRAFFLSDREDNKTIFMILDENEAQIARKVINCVVGDLSKPDTGILFSIPTLFVDGIS
ncbi:MAG: hypothetical protein RR177_06890 [Oscillospiraceae bacterium]